ncbi:hypothetical protein GC089_09235 [Cellulomonas sp. JZ18]|uniref:hypothetical protein n=1 Tax=Cellulomonas sp. JZ18 TaxID=2654191 RepID=UPI0012D40CAC|nr:hypothetical protein [Cellulomonas sp. JZ18]QGQ19382.1 hypothetical protein GC089_09235 [Cellulomonas sp. JZ18]
MKRLFWVGVGVALTVAAVRNGRRVVETWAPAGTVETVEGVSRVSRALHAARNDFRAGVAAREAELLEALVGDVDVDELRASAPRRKDELRAAFGGTPDRDDLAGGLRARGWDGAPTQDPDDDDRAPFF